MTVGSGRPRGEEDERGGPYPSLSRCCIAVHPCDGGGFVHTSLLPDRAGGVEVPVSAAATGRRFVAAFSLRFVEGILGAGSFLGVVWGVGC